jgi:heme/copper-type cytochrome/quinol oxidase subunit 2
MQNRRLLSGITRMATISLLLSAVSYYTFWMGLPVFIFPPLAFYFGFRSYRNAKRDNAASSVPQRIVWAIPALVALYLFVYEWHLLNSGKWA